MKGLDNFGDIVSKTFLAALAISGLTINPLSIANAQTKLDEKKSIPISIIGLDELLVFPSIFIFDFSSDTDSRFDLPVIKPGLL